MYASSIEFTLFKLRFCFEQCYASSKNHRRIIIILIHFVAFVNIKEVRKFS